MDSSLKNLAKCRDSCLYVLCVLKNRLGEVHLMTVDAVER